MLAKQNKQPTKCGYLFKYRPFSSGLFSNTWEPRFFTLNGSALQYYKSEKDTTLHPRGYVDVAVRLHTSTWQTLAGRCAAEMFSQWPPFLLCLVLDDASMHMSSTTYAWMCNPFHHVCMPH